MLDDLPFESELSQNLRAMRAACRKFLHVAAGDEPRILLNGGRRGDWASWVFNGALGELRGVFGIHLAQVCTKYGIDLENGLASILPDSDEGADGGRGEATDPRP